MKWQIKAKAKTHIVDLPSQIVVGRVFEAQIDGSPRTLRWDREGKTLYILESGSQGFVVERPISLRSIRSTSFP